MALLLTAGFIFGLCSALYILSSLEEKTKLQMEAPPLAAEFERNSYTQYVTAMSACWGLQGVGYTCTMRNNDNSIHISV